MKKFFLGLMAYGLVFQVQLLAQTGLQTDTDGSITGTTGTKYLWVNEANFPDESFRYYLQQMVASTANGGGKYVVPANVTNINLNIRCCSYYAGQILSNSWLSTCYYSWEREGQTYTSSSYYIDEPVPSPYIEQINAFFQDPQNVEEVQNSLGDGYDYILYWIRKYRKIVISTIEVSDGVHRVLKKDIEFYRAAMCRAAADAYDVYDEERVLYRDFIFSESETLHSEHNYYRTSGNVSDLTGINYFTSLQSLNCSNNQLTSLDLTALTKLGSLECSHNRLTDLKVNLVAHDWPDRYHWTATDSTYIDASKDVAHQRVYLDCSYNYLTNLNNVSVTPTAVGQLVNIEGSYANNRILAFPQGKHPYFDLDQGIFACGGVGNEGAWHAWEPYTDFVNTYMFPRISRMNAKQVSLFSGLGIDPSDLPLRYSGSFGSYFGNDYIALYLHPYGCSSYDIEYTADDPHYIYYLPSVSGFYSSQQNFGVNLSVIDKSRSRVGVSVHGNLRDDENSFEPVALLDNSYPPKVEQGGDTYYAFNGSGSTADLDYCHAATSVGYGLFNGYTAWTGSYELGAPGMKSFYGDYVYDLSALDINKYGDWFDPNINTYYGDVFDDFEVCKDLLLGGHDAYSQRCIAQKHDVTLTADHYVMYVNPISEDTEGKCNGTAIFDYNAIIPEGLEAFIVTGYTNGGEADRFKTGRLNLVKVGDGDCADGYKRVIPANNPVCLRTKQTVSEGQATDKMSTTGLYPFHNNDQRTNYPCEDPNDEQFEPLQSYTAGTVLTLGRYKDNNEHKIGFWTYNGTKLNMHRVYILKSDLNMPSEAKGCTLDFGYENSTTAIDGVGLGDNKDSSNTWYTLQGIRLAEKPTLKGIYIHNGKKVVVRSDDVVPSSNHTAATEDIYTDNF